MITILFLYLDVESILSCTFGESVIWQYVSNFKYVYLMIQCYKFYEFILRK